MKKSVSIIIPTYNRPLSLKRLLESIYIQTFKDFEVIVVDDGSITKQENEQVINNFVQKGISIKYIYQKNHGAPAARNRGIKEAKGKYVALVDDDDEWLHKKLQRQIELFERSPERVGLVYSWSIGLDKRGKLLRRHHSHIRGYVLKEILKECFFSSSSVMVKKECFEKVGLFDKQFPSCQDWEMWTRIAAKYEFDVVEEFLVKYYKHGNLSVGNSPNAILGYYMYFMKFKELYLQLKLEKYISRKLSWVGYELLKIGERQRANECFSLSFYYDKYNIKNCIRWGLGKLRMFLNEKDSNNNL